MVRRNTNAARPKFIRNGIQRLSKCISGLNVNNMRVMTIGGRVTEMCRECVPGKFQNPPRLARSPFDHLGAMYFYFARIDRHVDLDLVDKFLRPATGQCQQRNRVLIFFPRCSRNDFVLPLFRQRLEIIALRLLFSCADTVLGQKLRSFNRRQRDETFNAPL